MTQFCKHTGKNQIWANEFEQKIPSYLCSRNAIFTAFFAYNWICLTFLFLMQLEIKQNVKVLMHDGVS